MTTLTYAQRTTWACDREASMTFTFVSGGQRHTAAVPALRKHCGAVEAAATEWFLTGWPQEICLPPMTVPLDKAIIVCESIVHRVIVDGVGWTQESFTDPGGREAVGWAYGILLALGYSPWNKHADTIVQSIGMQNAYLTNTLVMARDALAPADLKLVVSQCTSGGHSQTGDAASALSEGILAACGAADTVDITTAAYWEGVLERYGPNASMMLNQALKPITEMLVLGGHRQALLAWADAVLAAGAKAHHATLLAQEAAAAEKESREPAPVPAVHPRFNGYFSLGLAHVMVVAAVYGRRRGAVSLKALVAALHEAGWFAHPEDVVVAEQLPSLRKHFALPAQNTEASGAEVHRELRERFHHQTVSYFSHSFGPQRHGIEAAESALHPDDALLLLLPEGQGGVLQGGATWPRAQVHSMLVVLARNGRVKQFLDVLKACGLYFVDDPRVMPGAAIHDDDDGDSGSDGDVSLEGKPVASNNAAAASKAAAGIAAPGGTGAAAESDAPPSIFSDDPNPLGPLSDAPAPTIVLQDHHGGYHHPLGGRACLAQLVSEASQAGHGAALRDAMPQRMHPSAAELASSQNIFAYPYTGLLSKTAAELSAVLDESADAFAASLKQYGMRSALLRTLAAARRSDLFMVVLTHEAFARLDEVHVGTGGWSTRQQWRADVHQGATVSLRSGWVSGAASLLPYVRDLQWAHSDTTTRHSLSESLSYQFMDECEHVARSNAPTPGCLHAVLHHPRWGSVGRGAGQVATRFYLNLGTRYAMSHPSKGVDSYDRPVGGYCVRDAALNEFLQELAAAGGGIQPPLGPVPGVPKASYDALLRIAECLKGQVATRRRAVLLKHVSTCESGSIEDARKWNMEMNAALGTLNWPAVLDLFETVPVCRQWSLGRAHFVASCVELGAGGKACPTTAARTLLKHATQTLGFSPEQLDMSDAQKRLLAES